MPISVARNSTNSVQGFTLAELIIVMVIIGLGIALALPRMSPLVFREQANSTLRVLTGALAEARSRALLTGTPKAVVINLDNDTFRLEDTSEPVASDTNQEANSDVSEAEAKTLSDWRSLGNDIQLRAILSPAYAPKEEGNVQLRVDGEGIFEPATLFFADEDGNVLPVELNSGTGNLAPLDDYDELTEELDRYERLHTLPQYQKKPWATPKEAAPDYSDYAK